MAVCRDDITKWSRFFLICIAGGTTLTYFTCPYCSKSFNTYLVVSLLESLIWIFLWGGNSFLGGYLDKKISWTQFPVKRFIVGVTVTITYTILVTVCLMESFARLFNFNYGGQYQTSIYISIFITALISLFLHGRGFLLSWREAAKDAEKLQKENAVAKYENLKSQVNPHFLFNSLNALTNLVYEDQDKAVKFIKQLSEVYRYVLDTREREAVGIEEELHFLKSYLFLQQIRFGNNLKADINLNNISGKIAPLALQMLIENAIKHNVVSHDDPLTIYVYQQDDFIIVENNIQKKSTLGEPSSGMGLDNICKRYDFLSDKKVTIAQTSGKFVVKLPVIQ